MKLLFENWRKFINEKTWDDLEADKGDWIELDPQQDIKASQDPLNIDLSDQLYDLINIAYAPIGGNYDYKNSGDLPGDEDVWLAVDLDDDPEPDRPVMTINLAFGISREIFFKLCSFAPFITIFLTIFFVKYI